MTAPKHTPGPWQAHGGWGSVVWSQHKHVIAECAKPGLSSEESTANMQLIAAAPELLEALRELHDFSQALTNRNYRLRSAEAFRNAAALLNRLGG